MPANQCPTEAVLRAFSHGELSEVVEDSIVDHIDVCVNCESKLAALEQRAAGALDRVATPGCDQQYVEEEGFREAAERVRNIGSRSAETSEFQPTVSIEQRELPAARIDQTIDSESSPVATSGDTAGFADLNSLLEAKRGKAPPFETEKTLAQGGMGAVLVGQDKALQRRVAVKVMKPQIAESDEHRARFLEEAQITGQLEHPNIVPIHDLGKDADGNLYFSMKLVKGQSLGQILGAMKQDRSSRSLTELLNIVLKIADGLAFAHSKCVVHRDLKPDNIMVGDFGEVLIMDWGLAKLLGRDSSQSMSSESELAEPALETEDNALVQTIKSVRATESMARTMDGTIQGTPAYMPPEQARGEIDRIDERSDVYSLGAVLYEVLTLQRPVEGKTLLEVVKNAAAGKVIPPEQRAPDRSIPLELSAVVMKAMQPSREERYQTVKELERDINLFLEGRAVSAKEDSLRESVVKLFRRNKAVSSAIAVAATIILTLATYSYIRITGERDRAVENELAASENEQRAFLSEKEARDSEAKAVDAQREQWKSALAASKQFALQTVELANVQRLEPAQRRAKDAAIVAPEGPWQYFASGAIAMARVDYSGAAELYRTALSKADGDQPEIRAALADALSREGSLEEAEALLADLDKIDDWRILLSAGRALYAAHNWDACQPPLARAIDLMEKEKDRPNINVVEAKQLLDAAPAQKACVGFYDEIRNLPFAEQQKRVAEKMEEIHAQPFALLRKFRNDRDDIVEFGTQGGINRLRHLYPLRGLAINGLVLGHCSVWDLSPLEGMPLLYMNVVGCRKITNLEPLRECKSLSHLNLYGTGVTDLSPIAALPIEVLNIPVDQITDLSPLQGMPLKELTVGRYVSDLSPLAGAPLKSLTLYGSRVYDLEPLRGAPLEALDCNYAPVTDLSPLSGMPLKHLEISHTEVTDLGPLKDCLTLKELDLVQSKITDLSGLKGSSVEKINLGLSAVTDLSGLAGLPLKELDLNHTRVHDISPLRDMPLEHLNLDYTEVTDLSPLVGSGVKQLNFFGCWIKDYSSLATMTNLEVDLRPWIPYLRGEVTARELEKRTQEAHKGRFTPEAWSRVVAFFVAMKKYADEGPSAAIAVLEKYLERWGTEPPTPNSGADFIQTRLKYLRDELAAQSDRPPE